MEPIKILVNDDITMHEWVKKRSKEKGIRKYAGERISGEVWSRGYQRWVVKTLMYDKLRDWYEERIIDPATGVILHECAEPFSAHQGHGSAKKRPASL